MQKQVLPFGLRFNLVEHEGHVIAQVAQTDVAKCIGGGRFDFLTVVVEALQDDILEAFDFAQIPSKSHISKVL